MPDEPAPLAPCPFCGPASVGADSTPIVTFAIDHYVFCPSCGCEGPWHDTWDGAVRAWNLRPDPEREAARATIDALRADLADARSTIDRLAAELESAGRLLESMQRTAAWLAAERDEARRELDAALAVAFHAGRGLFHLADDEMFVRLAASVRAWLDDDGATERVRISAAIRRAVGFGPRDGEQS